MRIRKHLHHLRTCLPTQPAPDPPIQAPPELQLHQQRILSTEPNQVLYSPWGAADNLPDLNYLIMGERSNGWIWSNSKGGGGGEYHAKKTENMIDDSMHHTYLPTKDPLGQVQDTEEKYKFVATTVFGNGSATACCGISAFSSSSSSSNNGGSERWCKEDIAFPLKKRRESFKQEVENEKKSSIRTKRNSALVLENEQDNGVKNTDDNKQKNKRARNNGNTGAILEGSRCSRVNGRGWRCCQQTLVGYSLCEHHLGKGRLKSISNVPKEINSSVRSSISPSSMELAEEKVLVKTKKGNRIGLVKARSMSSLLGIAQHAPSSISTWTDIGLKL